MIRNDRMKHESGVNRQQDIGMDIDIDGDGEVGDDDGWCDDENHNDGSETEAEAESEAEASPDARKSMISGHNNTSTTPPTTTATTTTVGLVRSAISNTTSYFCGCCCCNRNGNNNNSKNTCLLSQIQRQLHRSQRRRWKKTRKKKNSIWWWTLLQFIGSVIRFGVFICVPFIFFWNAATNNLIMTRQYSSDNNSIYSRHQYTNDNTNDDALQSPHLQSWQQQPPPPPPQPPAVTATKTTRTTVSDTAEGTVRSSEDEVGFEKTMKTTETLTVTTMEELSFLYANTTYRFRFNPAKVEEMIFQRSQQHRSRHGDGLLNQLPTIMFGVLSTAATKRRQLRRDAIRSTWGRSVPLLFLVAEPFKNASSSITSTTRSHNEDNVSVTNDSSDLVLEEFERYGDLLWLDVPEHYRALTPKSFMFLQFARKILQKSTMSSSSSSSSFSSSRPNNGEDLSNNKNNNIHHRSAIPPIDYIFKTDDDVWVNATEMSVELLQEKCPPYFGMRNGGKPVREPTAKFGSKWVLTKQEYPRDDYPPYASGLGYALSTTKNVLLDPTNGCINNTMSSMNDMPWEDVATGLLSEACHVPLTSSYKYWTDPGDGTSIPDLPFAPMNSKLKDGNTIVKIIHKPRPHWFNALMVQGSLEQANIQYEEQRKRARQVQRQQRKREAAAAPATTT